ncbi:MAG: 30S ribosome-binding factor RbfA [Desulfobacterales bacterium]|jgi:ribosome-binding factor A|nr:30S ribosome-binding factor RbfA [Desulfobacterales bacterium]
MRPFARAERVSTQIQRVLSEVLKKEISDPRLELVVITGVKMAADLKSARIFFSMPGGETARTQATEGFQKARPFIKRELAGRLGLRYMPDIKFFYDESFDYGARIENLLKAIHADDGSDHTSTEK